METDKRMAARLRVKAPGKGPRTVASGRSPSLPPAPGQRSAMDVVGRVLHVAEDPKGSFWMPVTKTSERSATVG